MILEFPSLLSTESILLDARIRGIVAERPLQYESGEWRFPLATVDRIVFGEVRIDPRVIDPEAIVEGAEVWVDGVFDFTRDGSRVVDEDIAPVLVSVFAVQVEPVGLGPHLFQD